MISSLILTYLMEEFVKLVMVLIVLILVETWKIEENTTINISVTPASNPHQRSNNLPPALRLPTTLCPWKIKLT